MKKQTITFLVFLLAVSGIFCSCGNATKQNIGLKFGKTSTNRTVHLLADTANPACNLVVDMEYAKQADNEELKDSVNNYILSLCLGDKYIGLTPDTAVQQYADRYTADYRKDLEPMFLKDKAENLDKAAIGAWYSYYEKVKGEVQLYQKNLLTYSYYYEEYTGGAHGIYLTTFLNLDLRTLTPIHLDDLFVEEYQEALTELLWNQLMVDNKVTTRQELEEMGYGSTSDLKPIDNFYLTPRGITFHYNVYEIAPYAMGNVTIHIPYEQMEHILSDDYAILQSIRKQ